MRVFIVSLTLIYLLIGVKFNLLGQDVPVDPYTGRAFINIPIYTLSEGDLSHSVSLSYVTDGIKFKEGSDNAGLGWNLVAAPAIYRQVRGIPDDYINPINSNHHGWLYNNLHATVGAYNFTSESNAYSVLNNLQFIKDTEPDIFYVNIPSYSGSFVFDNSGTIQTMPYADLKITVKRYQNTHIQAFDVVDDNGIRYKFEKSDTLSVHPGVQLNYPVDALYSKFLANYNTITAWYLTEIISPKGNNIVFTYKEKGRNRPPLMGNYILKDDDLNGFIDSTTVLAFPRDEIKLIKSYLTGRPLLTSISTNTEELVISYSGSPQSSTNKQVLQIKIIDKRNLNEDGEFVKKVQFKYEKSYSNQFSEYTGYSIAHNFLKEITEIYPCNQLPPYKFEYIGANLNSPNGTLDFGSYYFHDVWGYTTVFPSFDISNTIPRLYAYNNANEPKRLSYLPILGQTHNEFTLGYLYSSLNTSKVANYTLNKITYPTSAAVELTYEPNTFYESDFTGDQYAGGIRVKSVKVHDGHNTANDIITHYEYKSGANSSGKLISFPRNYFLIYSYTHNNMVYNSPSYTSGNYWKSSLVTTASDLFGHETTNGSSVGYTRVKISQQGKGGYTIINFAVPGHQFSNNTSNNFSTVQIARVNSTSPSDLKGFKAGYFTHPYPPNLNIDLDRGLVLNSTIYSENDNPIKIIEYSYTDYTPSTKNNIKALVYEKHRSGLNQHFYTYGFYTVQTRFDKVRVIETVKDYYAHQTDNTNFIQTSSEYFYQSNQHKYLTEIKRITGDGTTLTEKFKYPSDYSNLSSSSSDEQVRSLFFLKQQNIKNVMVEHSVFRKYGTEDRLLSSSLIYYRNIGTSNNPLIVSASAWYVPVLNPISNFTMSSVNASAVFQRNSSYKLSSQFVKYDPLGNLLDVTSKTHIKASTHYGFYDTQAIPMANFSNAHSNEVVYSSFDTESTNSFTISASTPTYVLDRNNGKALVLSSGNTLTKAFSYPGASKAYLLSFYAKKISTGTSTVNVQINVGGTVYSGNINIPSAIINDWQYFSTIISIPTVATANATATVSHSGTTIHIDDLLLLPVNAGYQLQSYSFPRGINSVTADNGKTTYMEKDGMGRTRLVRNNEREIIEINESNLKGYEQVFQTAVHQLTKAKDYYNVGEIAKIGYSLACIPGLTIEWKLNSGAYQKGGEFYNFTVSTGANNVSARITHPTWGQKIISTSISTSSAVINTCMAGITSWDICRVEPNQISNCTSYSPNTTRLSVTVNGCSVVSYQWEIRYGSGYDWSTITNATTSFYVFSDYIGQTNVQFRCKLSISCSTSPVYSEVKSINFYRSNPECIVPNLE